MDYDYILRKLDYVSEAGTMITERGYDSSWNVAV